MRPPTPAESGGNSFGEPSILGDPVSSPAAGDPIAANPVGSPMRSRSGPHAGPAGRVMPSPATGLLAAPVAEALAILPDRPARIADAGLSGGGCFARPLPIDTTCAAVARRFFREAVSSLAIPPGLVHDGVTMASELAANTLHAQREAAFSPARQLAAPGIPEIWIYLRGSGRSCELVCKVFDTERDWTAGTRPGMTDAPLDSVSGRGLQVVAGLSAGQWGCHLSRSRLGSWKVPGKAVWFALRIPPSVLPDHLGRPRYSPDWLIDELESMLADRGLAGSIVRADLADLSVLSISRHLTVWRHSATVSWRTGAGGYHQLQLDDIVEAAEQIVCAHEESTTGEPIET